MKKPFSIVFISFLSLSTLAQKFELGLGAGACHYKGDIAPAFKPFQFGPGGSAFIRYNLSRAVSFKAGAMFGEIHAKDKNNQRDLYLQDRGIRNNQDFSKTLLEFGGQVEYNFLNFRTNASRIVSNWTPYVFGGGMYINQTAPGVLFGIGMKKEWKRQWNWGIEFGTRALLPRYSHPDTDLDDFGFDKGLPSGSDEVNTMQGDLYYYTSFSISYVFYKVYCPPSR